MRKLTEHFFQLTQKLTVDSGDDAGARPKQFSSAKPSGTNNSAEISVSHMQGTTHILKELLDTFKN